MFNNVFGGLFGPTGPTGYGQLGNAQQSSNPYMTQGQMAQNNAAWLAQQQQAYTAAMKPEWMIAGKVMSITEFADELFGDTPARTMFLLKYSEKGK
jgi:hypothetical protein